MLPLPNSVLNAYIVILQSHDIPVTQFTDYKRWLRYYLDFCSKYPASRNTSKQIGRFLEKLRHKKQTEAQSAQAAHAVSMFNKIRESVPELVADVAVRTGHLVSDNATDSGALGPGKKSQYLEAGYEVKSDSPEWDTVLATMAAEIKVRHYSRKTLKTSVQTEG